MSRRAKRQKAYAKPITGKRARALFLEQETKRLIDVCEVDPPVAKVWAEICLNAYNRVVRMKLSFRQPRRRKLPT